MKRLLYFFAAAITAVTVLTGCAAQPQEEPQPQSQSQSQAQSQSTDSTPADTAVYTDEAPVTAYEIYDIDDNHTDVHSMIGENKLVMVNVWGTFCGPCINEMPDIEALYKKHKAEGFLVIGLTCDIFYNGTTDKAALNDAKSLRSELGITYPLTIETEELDKAFPADAVPTTYFIDQKGNTVGGPYVGSRSYDEWESIVTELLAKQ